MRDGKPHFEPDAREVKNSQREGGIFSISGKCLIEAPDRAIIDKFRDNTRIEYFPSQADGLRKIGEQYPLPDEEVASIVADIEVRALEGVYDFTVLDQLTERLLQSIEDQARIAIRGTVCSIDGDIDYEGIHVKDVQRVLADGTEKEGDTTLVAPFSRQDPAIHHRTTQWLRESVQSLRESVKARPDLKKKLFPIIIVYSPERLQQGERLYEVKLPDAPEDREAVIKKIYVLDYPKSRQELQAMYEDSEPNTDPETNSGHVSE